MNSLKELLNLLITDLLLTAVKAESKSISFCVDSMDGD